MTQTRRRVGALTIVDDPSTEPRSEAAELLIEEATPREVRKAISEMDDATLMCRRMRQHVWTPATAKQVRGGFVEVLRCSRCRKVEKEWEYDSRGHRKGSPKLTYDDGYLFTGMGRVGEDGKAVINLESLRRTVTMTSGGGVTVANRRRRARSA